MRLQDSFLRLVGNIIEQRHDSRVDSEADLSPRCDIVLSSSTPALADPGVYAIVVDTDQSADKEVATKRY